MASRLVNLGALVVLVTVVLLLLSEMYFNIEMEGLIKMGAAVGIGLFVLGLVLGILGKIGKRLQPVNKCRRCGRAIPSGRLYCETHSRETIDEYYDQNRE